MPQIESGNIENERPARIRASVSFQLPEHDEEESPFSIRGLPADIGLSESEMNAITPHVADLSGVNIFEAEFSRICSDSVINGGEIDS